jgi:DNA repair photolyase
MEALALKQSRLGLHETRPFNPMVMPQQIRGRGARSNPSGRYETIQRSIFDDGWQSLEDLPKLKTTVSEETAKTIISRNTSPDLCFDQSINPYRGCEHGCVYCYARPSHANMGLSPGLDFEAKLFAKTNAAELLRAELSKKNYVPKTIMLGANTDPYQPIERQYRITRQLLEVMIEFCHPVGIITKSALVLRDLDLLNVLAEKGLIKVAMSITSLDHKLSRSIEPRASTPGKRLQALEILSKAGIPAACLIAPIIPAVNDVEIEKILGAVSVAGVREAGFVMLRLPAEVRPQFKQWLMAEMPDRAAHVISLVRSLHGGKDYDSRFGQRRRGTGPYAWSVARRFELAAKRLKLNGDPIRLKTEEFVRPPQPGEQLSLL